MVHSTFVWQEMHVPLTQYVLVCNEQSELVRQGEQVPEMHLDAVAEVHSVFVLQAEQTELTQYFDG